MNIKLRCFFISYMKIETIGEKFHVYYIESSCGGKNYKKLSEPVLESSEYRFFSLVLINLF